MNAPTYGSLFSGIGGMDLGLDRAGWTCRWNSEIDPHASKVLAKHWPHVPNLGDVTTIDWSHVEHVDLICGGYPCQPFSSAGLQRGVDDPRHLWPRMLDAVRHLRPRYVLIENVAAHLVHGFDAVLCDLASLGFDAEWSIVSACSVGAPHLRRRLFCVAYADGHGRQWLKESHSGPVEAFTEGEYRDDPYRHGVAYRASWSREPRPVGVADGVPGGVARRRAAGNAVVPQVAELVGRRILESMAVSS